MDPIELSLFANRIAAVCEEMGAQLRHAAFSPNIRDRLDFSCAVFGPAGELCAQAAHIPVHLGSMASAMRDVIATLDWRAGDMAILNDPFLGGTHLPDVTLIAPLYQHEELVGFVANRAHHADIGADAPGSMPISSDLAEEGIVIPPQHLMRADRVDDELMERLVRACRNRQDAEGDFAAQVSANRRGVERLGALVEQLGVRQYGAALEELNDYAERLARAALAEIPTGTYRFREVMDDDGMGHEDVAIEVQVEATGERVHVGFDGTAAQVAGNINCPLAVTAAAVFYVFRCLMPAHTPACAGSLRPVRLSVPPGCLLNAARPAAVAAGNVETSTRVVDAVLGALAAALPERIPAASHGSMNNLAMGASGERSWGYYETLGGGMGAGPHGGGLHGVQTHMTNTRNTPIEVLELRYPLRIRRYGLRRGSGGAGARAGGDGLIREYELLAPTHVTVITERRRHRPWGLAGGGDGQAGRNWLAGAELPPKVAGRAAAGDRLTIETPGGGGWGQAGGGG